MPAHLINPLSCGVGTYMETNSPGRDPVVSYCAACSGIGGVCVCVCVCVCVHACVRARAASNQVGLVGLDHMYTSSQGLDKWARVGLWCMLAPYCREFWCPVAGKLLPLQLYNSMLSYSIGVLSVLLLGRYGILYGCHLLASHCRGVFT